jgi:hypothetical protein
MKRQMWPFSGYPNTIAINGKLYVRQGILSMSYPCVVAQYREWKAFNSGHMYVYQDGTFEVNHIDWINPNVPIPGFGIAHLLLDLVPALPSVSRHKWMDPIKGKGCGYTIDPRTGKGYTRRPTDS